MIIGLLCFFGMCELKKKHAQILYNNQEMPLFIYTMIKVVMVQFHPLGSDHIVL